MEQVKNAQPMPARIDYTPRAATQTIWMNHVLPPNFIAGTLISVENKAGVSQSWSYLKFANQT